MSWQSPVANSTTNATQFDLTVVRANATQSIASKYSYCGRSQPTDYTWDGLNGTRTYVNNTCVPYYEHSELVERGFQSVWLYTYWQQSNWARLCVPATDVPKYYMPDPPGWPPMPDEGKDYDFNDPGFVPNCAPAQQTASASVLTVEPERAVLTISATYTTSWGRTRSAMPTTIEARPGAAVSLAGQEPLSFTAEQPVQATFKQLLAIAGIDLDAANVLEDGGVGPANGSTWPVYRVTGVSILADLVHGNYVENKTKLDPFNFADFLTIRLYPATVGTFAGPGTRLFYMGHLYDLNQQPQLWTPPGSAAGTRDPYPWPESLFLVRSPQGVQIQFVAAGQVGRFNGLTLLAALVNIIVLGAIAQSITDISAGFLINGFRAQKYMDDLELRIRLMLRSQLADSPNADQVRMFENEMVEMYGNRAYQASILKRMAEEERKAAEKYGGGEAAARAEGPAVADERDKPPPLQSKGATLRSAPVTIGTVRESGGLQDVTPHVRTLLIQGEPTTGTWFTAQGYLENCRCVRFQWLKSLGGQGWEAIPFATMPSFYATADDANCLLAVDAVPVTDDGFEGPSKRAKLGPLRTRPDELRRAEALVEEAKGVDGARMEEGLTRAGTRVVLTLRTLDVSLRAHAREGMDFGRLPMAGALVELDRRDPAEMRIVAAHGGDAAPSITVSFESPEERDVAAIAIRLLAAGKLELEEVVPHGPNDVPTDDEE